LERRVNSFEITGSRKHNNKNFGAESNARHTGTKFPRGAGDDRYLVKVRNNMSTQSHKRVTNTKEENKEMKEDQRSER